WRTYPKSRGIRPSDDPGYFYSLILGGIGGACVLALVMVWRETRTYSKREVLDALTVRFPDADRNQLRRFLEDGWDGGLDEWELAVLAEAWLEGQHAAGGPVVY